MTISQRLDALVRAACPAIDGVSMTTPPTVQFRPEATAEQRLAAQAVVDGFDPSDAAQAAWEKDRETANAVIWFAGSEDKIAIALRVIVRDLYTRVNDLKEKNGAKRDLEPDIVARLVASVEAGAGAKVTV